MGKLEPRPIQTIKVAPAQPNDESIAYGVAEADPLPGPLLKAFDGAGIKIAGHTVRKFVAYDHVLLKKINSPLHRSMVELSKPQDKREEVASTTEEEADLCLLFTISCKDAKELIEKDETEFHALAMERFALNASSEEMSLILMAIFQQVQNNIATGNKYMAEAKEANEITFLEPPTASAGG